MMRLTTGRGGRFLTTCAVMLLCCTCTGRRGGGSGNVVPGDVHIHVTTSAMDDDNYQLDASKDTLGLTLPVGRDSTATYVRTDDPSLSLEILIDTVTLQQGDRVDFPLTGFTNSNLRISAVHRGITYSSDRAGPMGQVYFEQLQVSDVAMDLRVSFTLTISSDGNLDAGTAHTLTLDGFLKAHQGSTAMLTP